MSNPITYNVAMEVASHEALVRQAYKDSVGKWTWSIGLTSATGHQVTRYIGKPQSLQKCLDIYVWALDRYAEQVRRLFEGTPLSEAQFAAILSWTWNLGVTNLRKASWVGHFKAGKMAQAETSFKSWNKAGGRKLKGLVTRRQKEADLLFRSKWSHSGTLLEFTKLTGSSTPNFKSGVTQVVEWEMKTALARRYEATIDVPPQPDAEGPPTLTSDEEKIEHDPILIGLVTALLAAASALAAYFGLNLGE